MTCKRIVILLAPFVAIALMQLSTVRGEEPETLKLTVYPQAFPRPALKYQLLPEFKDRLRGNAAVYYGKVTAEHTTFFGNMQLRDKIDEWRDAPLADLLKPEVEFRSSAIEKMLRMAARCESCDWQLPIREETFYTIALPEVQQLRQFARILATRARIQIAHGEFDDAIETLQTGLAIGRNAAEGETIVNGLVGVAVESIMLSQVLDLIQQPKAPNLYWALSTLPRPLIDLRKGAEAEMSALAQSFPEVRDLRAKRTPAEWDELHAAFWRQVLEVVEPDMKKDLTAEALVAESFVHVAAGRQQLLSQGVDPNVVGAMPNAQVALIQAISSYEIDRDNLFRWFLLPYDEGLANCDPPLHGAEMETKQRPTHGRLSQLLLPDLFPARQAAARLDREIGVLRIIEALRMYAATHDGRLPEKLTDVINAPIPLDPMTGKPYDYRLQDDIATLSVMPLHRRVKTYEIRVAKP